MSGPYNISDVSRLSGIPRDLLRMWERRYGYPNPRRDRNGDRVYDVEQLRKLVIVRQLLERGNRPGKLMALSIEELRAMLETAEQPPAIDEGRLLALLQTNDAWALHQWLQEALLAQGLRSFVHNVVTPATQVVGQCWAAGQLTIHQEHLYTETIRRLIDNSLEALPGTAGDPRIMLTTVPGEQHALGLLMVEALLRLGGATVIPFGIQMPFGEILEAAEQHEAQIVGLSFSAGFNSDDARVLLDGLRRLIPEQIEMWAGGAALAQLDHAPSGVRVFLDLYQVERALAAVMT